jgi:hypothetical protein
MATSEAEPMERMGAIFFPNKKPISAVHDMTTCTRDAHKNGTTMLVE